MLAMENERLNYKLVDRESQITQQKQTNLSNLDNLRS